MPLWTVNQMAEIIGAPLVDGPAGDEWVGRVVTTWLVVEPGDVYAAVSPEPARRAMGVANAFKRGAVAVIADPDVPVPPGAAVLTTARVPAALRALGHAGRQRFGGAVVGVTGSVGKTTTKDMLASVLATVGETHSTHANFNTGVANAATVASLPPRADFAVLEIAMVGPGTVRAKTRIARPHVGVITSIGVSHGSWHASTASIVTNKLQLFESLEPGGAAVLPSASPSYDEMVARLRKNPQVGRIISCGERADDDVRIVHLEERPTHSLIAIDVGGERFDYVVSQPGRPFVQNSLLVAGVLTALEAPLSAMSALRSFAPTHRRLERFRIMVGDQPAELIDDAYNAAPDSVQALLELLRNRSRPRRKVLFLGDMLELGAAERELHLQLAPDVASADLDLLVTVGRNTAALGAVLAGQVEVVSFDTAQDAAAAARQLVQPFDLVAVKASNAVNLLAVVKELRGSEPSRRQSMDWCIEDETEAA